MIRWALLVAMLETMPAIGGTLFVGTLVMGTNYVYTYDPDTIIYGAAITNNSGTINSNDFLAVDTFVKAAKANNYWSNILECSPLAGEQTNAAVVKLVAYPNPSYSTNIALSANMTSDYYSKSFGWSNYAGGSFRYLQPGFNLSEITNALPGIGVYVTSRPKDWGDGAGMIAGFWFAGPPYVNLSTTFYPTASRYGGYVPAPYWGTNAALPDIEMSAGPIRYWGVNQDSLGHQMEWMGLNAVATNNLGFNTDGNNNKFRLLGEQNASDQYSGSIGFWIMHKEMTRATIPTMIADIARLMGSLGRDNVKKKSLWVVPITGQSLATASGSTTNLSDAFAPFDNFSQTIRTPQTDTALAQVDGCFPIKETRGLETIQTSWAWEAQSLGISNQIAILTAVHAVGGAAYSNLLNIGSTCFTNNISLMTNGANYANTYYTSCVVPAILVIHGESDMGNTYYQQDLTNWVKDYGDQAISVTGQTNQLKMFHTQHADMGTVANCTSDLAMLAEHEKASRSNILVGPKYFLPYSQWASPHLNAQGYQQLGEYYGKAFYKEFFGGGAWEPLRPVDVQRVGATITITFTNTTGGLVFDSNNIPSITNHVAATNFGFTYTDAGTPPAISSVAISGASSNQVTITLSSTPTGSSKLIRYGVWEAPGSGDRGGTTNILHGNLRNNDPTVGVLSTSNLWDWCVHFEKSVL